MKLELDCKQVSRLLSAAQDDTLPEDQRVRMRLHLAACEACRNVQEQLEFIRRALQRLGRDDDPPPRR